MRATSFIAASLDGYIARRDGGLDWLPQDSEIEDHGYDAFMATVDGVVLGRKTFETVQRFDAWPYGDRAVVVLSRTLREAKAPQGGRAEVLAGPPAEVHALLARRGLQHLYVDGGATVTEWLAAGVLDRIVLTRIPVLLGGGVPLFGSLPRDVRLRHVATRAFRGGLVQSEYLVGPGKA